MFAMSTAGSINHGQGRLVGGRWRMRTPFASNGLQMHKSEYARKCGMKKERKTRTLLRAKSSSSDGFAPRLDGTDRVDVALIFRSLVGACNTSFSGMNMERRGDLGGRGGTTD